MLARETFIEEIRSQFRVHKIVAVLGPRQCGKTTICREYIQRYGGEFIHSKNYFDLENPHHLDSLDNPMETLSALSGLIVIDEIQRRPDLFPVLRVLHDDPQLKQQYLILGSASRDLLRQSSESLAGRIGYLELGPFNLKETHEQNLLWSRGGFPRSYLAEDNEKSWAWREDYVMTFLERDIPNLGIKIAPNNLRKFWYMLAHYHANIFNSLEISRSLGLTYNACKNYLDVLSDTFMVRQLVPWYVNIGKRQVKAPKIYFRDSGILHLLLGVRTSFELDLHPKVGASWEGFALEQVIKKHNKSSVECFFWSTYSGAEIDLIFLEGGRWYGFEFKRGDVPKRTKSMMIALEELKLEKITVIYPGKENYSLHEKIEVIGLESYILN